MENRILFLEDRYSDRTWIFLRWLPQRIEHVVTVSNATEAIRQLQTGSYTHVFLDHDLDWIHTWPNAMTGMDVVKHIEETKPTVQKFIIHSTSAKGGEMNERLIKAGYNSVWLPFETQLIRIPATHEAISLNT